MVGEAYVHSKKLKLNFELIGRKTSCGLSTFSAIEGNYFYSERTLNFELSTLNFRRRLSLPQWT